MERNNKLEQFTKFNLVLVRKAFEKALSDVEKKFGLKPIEIGEITFSDFEFSTKLIVKIGTKEASNEAKKRQKIDCELLGLPSNCIGKTIELDGKQYTIDGVDTGKPKYAVNVTRYDGRKVRTTVASVLRSLEN